jgi:hypothetical protein
LSDTPHELLLVASYVLQNAVVAADLVITLLKKILASRLQCSLCLSCLLCQAKLAVCQVGARDLCNEKLQSIEEEDDHVDVDVDDGLSINCIYILMGNPTKNGFQ